MKKLRKLFFILILLSGSNTFAAKTSKLSPFELWKQNFIDRSSKKGLSKSFLIKQLKNIKYQPSIIDKDRNQVTSSTKINYPTWIKKWIGHKPTRIQKGKANLKKYDAILTDIEKRYGVDKEIIVSLWGVETLYGKIMGKYKIIESLTTLAFDKRRRAFFENELLSALIIIKEGHIKKKDFLGSWAGAMGQCQFMPSSFLKYAQDYDGDGKKDIWTNKKDIFASIANFLKKADWKKNKSIGLLVNKKGVKKRFEIQERRSPSNYNKLGVRLLNGRLLKGKWKRRAAVISHKNSPLILRGSNYETIMKWNRSSLFAALNIMLMDAFK
ncbi:MAG: lytic transglycosylase [Halobacteriovoraceae bacterium]|nr:lytic transglycosylase [Halobacteriovoraceae bacterium]